MIGNILFNRVLLASAADFALNPTRQTHFISDVFFRLLIQTGELIRPQEALALLRLTCPVVVLGSALAGYLIGGAFAGAGVALIATALFHRYVRHPLLDITNRFASVHLLDITNRFTLVQLDTANANMSNSERKQIWKLTLTGNVNLGTIAELMLLACQFKVESNLAEVTLTGSTLEELPEKFFKIFYKVEIVRIINCDQLKKFPPLEQKGLMGFFYVTHSKNSEIVLEFDKNDAEKIKSLFPVNKSQLQWVEDGNSCKPEFAQELVQEFESEGDPDWRLTTDF